ncbi:MAG: ABC transporter permease [Ruminococcaceae bacterium]|nr:ABC transporter permease [Oscillospiraceae bacterium]
MSTFKILLKRNIKLFFKDKGLFFTSLITPAILLVLYATFLGNVFEDSFLQVFSGVPSYDKKLIDGCVGGQLISSILAVSCVTVPFCSNMLMVQDKVNGSIRDITVSPVKSSTVALAYYFATLASSLIICFSATGLCLGYVATVGWYLSGADVLLIILDVFLLVLFGTALSSVINVFMSTQGQISAVGSIVSSVYGFICGAYMPISQFSPALQKTLSFLPGTYGTSLLRNHSLNGCFEEMRATGVPEEAVDGIRAVVDCDIKFFDNTVPEAAMFAVLCVTVTVLIALYVLLNKLKNKK